MNRQQKSEIIKALALADEANLNHVVDILLQKLAVNPNQLPLNWQDYDDEMLKPLLKDSKILWIKTFRETINEKYNYLPSLKEAKDICDMRNEK